MSKVTIELTEEQLEAIKKTGILEDKGGWFEPKEGGRYWFLTEVDYASCFYNDDDTDKEILARGQVFATEEEAEKADRWRIALTAIRKYIATNMPFKPDWGDGNQRKYYAYCETDERIIEATSCAVSRTNPLDIYVSSSANAEQLIKDQEQNLKILFGVE